MAAAVLLLGPLSILFWLSSANVTPWLVIQFGGMAIILWVAFGKPLYSVLSVRWGVEIAVYAVATLFEAADHQIYALTSQVSSGHSLEHFVASFAAWAVVTALSDALGRSQNKGKINVTSSDKGAAR